MYQNTAFLNIYVYSLVLTEVLNELLPLAFMVIIDRVFGLSRWWLWHLSHKEKPTLSRFNLHIPTFKALWSSLEETYTQQILFTCEEN